MKNIADTGILARIRKLAPQSAERAAPFRTPEEWREWQLAEGRRSCEEIDRQNRQARAEKNLRSGRDSAAASRMLVRKLPDTERRPAPCTQSG